MIKKDEFPGCGRILDHWVKVHILMRRHTLNFYELDM